MLCIKCHTTSQVQFPSMQIYFPSRLPMNSTLVHEQSDTFGRGEKIDAWPQRNLQMPGSCQNCIEATNRGTAVLLAQASISIETLRRVLFCLDVRSFYTHTHTHTHKTHTHTHTHTQKKPHTPDIHSQPRQALIHRQTQTHIDSLPCCPPLAHSQTAHHLTTQSHTHTHTHTHTRTRSRSLSGASI